MRLIKALFAVAVVACARTPAVHDHGTLPVESSDASAYGREVADGYARVRSATAPFRSLDSAVARGYAANVTACIADSTQGAMGFHHINRGYVDDKVEVEKPEFLLYERKPDGSYALNAVEYIVPFRVWPKDSVPPKVLGRDMLRSETLQYWYLHMWAWTPNKSGLFADWNPAVRCNR
jgi:hypothetical protein